MEKPSLICEGGDLDCGSGLLLIIKSHLDQIQEGEILGIHSSDSSVRHDLPAWCRLSGNEFLSEQREERYSRYLVKKGITSSSEVDKEAAKKFKFMVRIKPENNLWKVYVRNHSYLAGNSIDFGNSIPALGGVDGMIAALGTCLVSEFKSIATKKNIILDAMEISLKGSINNILNYLRLEEDGSPALSSIEGTFYVTSPAEEVLLLKVWEEAKKYSPVYRTLFSVVKIEIKLEVVL